MSSKHEIQNWMVRIITWIFYAISSLFLFVINMFYFCITYILAFFISIYWKREVLKILLKIPLYHPVHPVMVYALKTREWICPLSENELSWNWFMQVSCEEYWRCAVSLVSLWLGCSTSQHYWFDTPTASCSFYRSPFRRLLPLPFTLSCTSDLGFCFHPK